MIPRGQALHDRRGREGGSVTRGAATKKVHTISGAGYIYAHNQLPGNNDERASDARKDEMSIGRQRRVAQVDAETKGAPRPKQKRFAQTLGT